MTPQQSIGALFLVSFGIASAILPAHAATAAQQQAEVAQATEPPPSATSAQPGDQTPAVNPPQSPADLGLIRSTTGRLRIVYTLPGTDWTRFRTIQLRPLVVPPDATDATPTNRRTRGFESFMLGDREVSALQDAFSQVVRNTLTRAGYTFVDTPQADTLIVAPTVTNITLAAPIDSSRRGGRTRTYTQGAGSISVSAVFADAGSGQVIGMASAGSRPSRIWRINNRVTNMSDARIAFGEWASDLRNALQGRS